MHFALSLAFQIQDPLGGARALWAGTGPPGLDQSPWAVFLLVPLPCTGTSGAILLAGGGG